MTARLIGLTLLLGATACATTQSPRPTLSPRNGPKASIRVSYEGYLTDRTVRPSFYVDKPAHVLVGRLGGDGRIEILFPETPRSPSLVAPRRTHQVEAFTSIYDGVPQRFRYASPMPRSPGARFESYDGLGNGFVFIIATEHPMFTEMLDDHGFWSDSLVVEDYYSLNDPRYAIRDFAEVLTRGMPYSLDYANSFTSTVFASYGDIAYDCQLLQSQGYGSFGLGGYGLWFGSFYDPGSAFMFRYSRYGFSPGFGYLNPGCGGYYRRPPTFYYRIGFGTGQPVLPGVPNPNTAPPATPTTTPTVPRSSRFNTGARRPGFLMGEDNSRRGISTTRERFTVDRPTQSSKPWAPPINEPRSRPDPIVRTNGSNMGSGTFGKTRTDGVARTSQPAQTAKPAPAKASPPPKPVVQNPGSTQRDP